MRGDLKSLPHGGGHTVEVLRHRGYERRLVLKIRLDLPRICLEAASAILDQVVGTWFWDDVSPVERQVARTKRSASRALFTRSLILRPEPESAVCSPEIVSYIR